ncbi:RNA-directed DNA polymerase, eukaryota, reverse transcriptase zinc-binding domain protein, partial [Tanacetum coccineum]
EALDEEACLEEQILSLMHRFANRFTNRRPEINRLMILDDHPLIEYGRYALGCMTGADMKKDAYLKSVRDELLRSMEEKRQLIANYREIEVRFLISEDVTIRLPDVRITALDRLWSDHNPILLHIDKTDFGPTPFKLYNSWLLRDGFDNLIKEEWELLDSNLKCHEKFRRLKDKIKQWSNNTKTLERNRKTVALEEINSIEKRIEGGTAYAFRGNETPASYLLQEIEKIIKQSAFIVGRQILDGPVILSEIIEWYKKRKKKLLIFKVDFEKAFDSISWNYLIHILDSFGFARDPLSPFLFILVMEGLHNAFEEAVGNGLITGVNIKNSTINVSHLFYADDVIITTDWNAKDMDNIIRVLHVFYLASGLKINIHKSNIYGIGVIKKFNIKQCWLMTKVMSLSIILVLPLFQLRSLCASRKTLDDRFHMRLSSLKANLAVRLGVV